MMGRPNRIPGHASFWWQSISNTFERPLREFIERALKAEQAENGHQCGHTFEIIVRSKGHYGLAGHGPEEHSDANYWDECRPVQVRAHNLRDALLVAATRPLGDFIGHPEEYKDGD
jgi:hypothetical protein